MSVGWAVYEESAFVEDFLRAGHSAKALCPSKSCHLILRSFDMGASSSFHFIEENLEAQRISYCCR